MEAEESDDGDPGHSRGISQMVPGGEKPFYAEDNIIKTPTLDYKPEAGGLGHLMFHRMQVNADKIAQIDAVSGEKETHGSLLRHAIRVALHLLDKGIKKDDIIGMCSDNNLDSALPFIASLFIGAKIICLDPTQSEQEFTYILDTMKPKMLFVVPKVAATMSKILPDAELVVFGENFAEYDVAPHPEENTFQPIFVEDLKETALMVFSSGSTGYPKGICLNHYSMLHQMHRARFNDNPDREKIKEETSRYSLPITMVNFASLYWVSGQMMVIIASINGTCRLLCNDFQPKQAWDFIIKYKPSGVFLVPAAAVALCRHGKPKDADLSFLLRFMVIGSPISKENILMIRETFPEAVVMQAYGQSETSSMVTNFKPTHKLHIPYIKAKPESVGLPVHGITYKVADMETDEALGPNQKGELKIKSDMLMNGYYNRNSADCYDENGWFKTGDIAYYDDDFCFYIVDRIRELFKYKGWHITPALIENELLNHPAVKEAVVLGLPHEEDGDHPVGIVTLNEDYKNITGKEIEEFVNGRVLERQRLRAGVRIIDRMPLTPTGKVNRRIIKVQILNDEV